VIGFPSCVAVESMLISLSIEGYYVGSFGALSRRKQRYMLSGALYRVAPVRTLKMEAICSPKRQFLLQRRGVTPQKTFVTVTAVKHATRQRSRFLLHGQGSEEVLSERDLQMSFCYRFISSLLPLLG
jgi:hypothetical protein